MPAFTILFGIGLIAIGTGTYIGAGEEWRSGTDLILYLILGLLAIGLGIGSIVKKPLRMHLMHGAVILGAMGVIVPGVLFANHIYHLPPEQQMDILRTLLTVLISAVYVYAAVRSFRAARRDRKNQPAQQNKTPDEAPHPTDPV